MPTPAPDLQPQLPPLIEFQAWLAEHRHLLQPPVGNKVLWQNQDFICMIVGGPNARTDYHYDEGPEFFHQLEGEMVLRLMLADGPRDVAIQAGQMYLLPPRVPHSPQRMAGSVGLVIERKRLSGELDGLLWFCPNCHHKLFEAYFELTDIETQFGAIFEQFYESTEHRTCDRCGTLHPRKGEAPG